MGGVTLGCSVRRWWPVVAVLLATAAVLSSYLAGFGKPNYIAKAVVVFEYPRTAAGVYASAEDRSRYVSDQVSLFTLDRVHQEVADELNVRAAPGSNRIASLAAPALTLEESGVAKLITPDGSVRQRGG